MAIHSPDMGKYRLSEDAFLLFGSPVTLDDVGSPTFMGLRQRGFCFDLSVELTLDGFGGGGVTCYMCENERFDLALRRRAGALDAVLKLNIGEAKHTAKTLPPSGERAKLMIQADSLSYRFLIEKNGSKHFMGQGSAKYLSSEVSGGFTGVILGLYTTGETAAKFQDLQISYRE